MDFPDVPPYCLYFDIDEWISPSEYSTPEFYAIGADVEAGYMITYSLEIASGGSVSAFFIDTSNLTRFSTGDSYSSYEQNYIYSEKSVTFEVPYSGTWYLVIHNPSLSENRRVTGSGYFEVTSATATFASTVFTTTSFTTTPSFLAPDEIMTIALTVMLTPVVIYLVIRLVKKKPEVPTYQGQISLIFPLPLRIFSTRPSSH